MAKKETGAPSVLSSFADLANIPSLINNTNSPVDDAQADEDFNEDYLDAQDLIAEPGSIVGVAGKPMTEISIDGREVIHQPMTIESMLSTHAPYRFKVDPTRISFNGAGQLPALGDATSFVFRPTGIKDIPGPGGWGAYPWGTGWPLGIVLRVVINDTQIGEGSIGIETLPGLKAEWSVTNGAGESMLCILSHQEDYVITSNTEVANPANEEVVKKLAEGPREELFFTPNSPVNLNAATAATGLEESKVGGAADNYFFTPNNELDYIITGANVIVHVYPIYLTREIQAITAAALTADRLPDLAGFFAEGYLSQE